MIARFLLRLFFAFFQLPLYSGCALEDGAGKPLKPLLTLLDLYHISHDGSWPSIQKATEEAWLNHGRATERWEIAPIEGTHPKETFALFSALGMTERECGLKSHYHYGLVLGATLQVVRQRFWSLKQEWERGVRFDTLIILTGDRPLDPQFESERELIDPSSSLYPFRPGWRLAAALPKNETEMMQLVFDQLDLPEAWRSMQVIFVDTPKPPGFKRPHTEHTLLYWLTMKPTPGSLLVVSNQPFICRQDALLRTYLPPEFCMESVGEGIAFEKYLSEKRALAVFLAELAYRIKIAHSQ